MECAPSSQSKACHTTQSTANVLKHQLQDNPESDHSHGGCQGSTGDMTLCEFAQLMPLSTFPLIELCDLRMEHFSQCRRCRQGSRPKNHDNQWWYRATTRSAALTLPDNLKPVLSLARGHCMQHALSWRRTMWGEFSVCGH